MSGHILCIETATGICSAALFSGETLMGYQEYRIEKSHSSLLPRIVESTLWGAGVEKSQIGAVAVSAGPGSYTGLRIGTSIAKGLCFSLDLPLIAVDTLQLMAAGVSDFNRNNALLCPMIDARRMEVYAAVYDWRGGLVEEIAPRIIDEASFAELLDQHQIWFFGDGSAKCQAVIGHHPNAVFLHHVFPSAKAMGKLASERYQSGLFEDLAYFEPFYLKEFRVSKPKSHD